MSNTNRKPYYLMPLVVGAATLVIDIAVTSRFPTPLPFPVGLSSL